jgi:hypothetical protein
MDGEIIEFLMDMSHERVEEIGGGGYFGVSEKETAKGALINAFLAFNSKTSSKMAILSHFAEPKHYLASNRLARKFMDLIVQPFIQLKMAGKMTLDYYHPLFSDPSLADSIDLNDMLNMLTSLTQLQVQV